MNTNPQGHTQELGVLLPLNARGQVGVKKVNVLDQPKVPLLP